MSSEYQSGGDIVLWLVALTITLGLCLIALWQLWVHRRLDERIANCDPTLLSSVSHKVETSTDAPPGSQLVPFVPVQMIPLESISGGGGRESLPERVENDQTPMLSS